MHVHLQQKSEGGVYIALFAMCKAERNTAALPFIIYNYSDGKARGKC